MMPNFKALIERIAKNEGYRQDVYKCTAGHDTVGIGFALKDLNISQELAHDIIKWQIEKGLIRISLEHSKNKTGELISILHLRWLDKLTWYKDLPPMVQTILIEMSFQMGISGVSKFRKMLKAMQEKNWKGASEEMKDSLWYRQTPGRCERLAQIVREHG